MSKSNIQPKESEDDWNKSQLALLQAARDEFWKFGVRKVNVEDICQTAGLSKMTFYRHFKNKKEVVEIVIRQYLEDSMANYNAIISKDISFKERISEVLLLKQDDVSDVSKAFIEDVYLDEESGMKFIFDEYRDKMLLIVMNDFKKAQEEGEIRQDLDLKFVEYILNDMKAKVMDPRLVAIYPNQKDLIMQISNFFFYGILER